MHRMRRGIPPLFIFISIHTSNRTNQLEIRLHRCAMCTVFKMFRAVIMVSWPLWDFARFLVKCNGKKRGLGTRMFLARQEKGAVVMNTYKKEIEEKINELRWQTKSYVEEVKKMVGEMSHSHRSESIDVISYFTSSFNISYEPEIESLCLGSYTIRNIGDLPLNNPKICIKLPEDSPFAFSGKYVYEYFKQSAKGSPEWERIDDKTNKYEFWFQPINQLVIEPNEMISFSDFQIRWSNEVSYGGSITAFMYCDELKDGVAVVNPINLSGFSTTKEDNDE